MLDADVDPVQWLGDTPAPTAAPPSKAGPHRWWIAAGAVGGIVALVVAANAIGGPNDRPRAAPTTTAAVTTSTVAPTTTAPPTTERAGGLVVTSGSLVDPDPPIIVADPPADYTVAYADRYDNDSYTEGPQLLFASGVDDPSTAAWVMASPTPSPTIEPMPLFSSGRSRLAVARGVALIDRNEDGTTMLTAPIAGGILMLRAFAIDDTTLTAIVDEAVIDGDGLASDTPFTSRGLQLLAAAGADDFLDPPVTTTLSFSSTSDADTWITVTSGSPPSTFERAVRTFMRRDAHAVAVGGVHTAIVGRDARYGWLTAIVDVDGTEVNVSGNVGEDELLAVIGTLRVADDDEWRSLVVSATTSQASSSAQMSGPAIALRSGTMTDAASWQLILQPSSGLGTVAFLTIEMTGSTTGQFVGTVQGGSQLDEPLATGQPGIQPIATTSGVVLVGVAGRDHAGARLVVTAGDLTLTDTLTDPGDAAPGLFGAVGYSELVPYHAELVDADGTVLAVLDGM